MTTFALSAVGVTPGVSIAPRNLNTSQQVPTLLTSVSAGGSLTYQVEVTTELPTSNNNNDGSSNWPSSTNWYPIAAMTGLTTGSDQLLSGVVYGVRARITAYTSGTLNLSVGQ